MPRLFVDRVQLRREVERVSTLFEGCSAQHASSRMALDCAHRCTAARDPRECLHRRSVTRVQGVPCCLCPLYWKHLQSTYHIVQICEEANCKNEPTSIREDRHPHIPNASKLKTSPTPPPPPLDLPLRMRLHLPTHRDLAPPNPRPTLPLPRRPIPRQMAIPPLPRHARALFRPLLLPQLRR